MAGNGDRTGADTSPGGSKGDNLCSSELQKALGPIRNELAELRRQVNDQGRQTSKDEIVFEGTAVMPQEGETPLATLRRIVSSFWERDLKDCEVKQVKLRKRGEDKWRLQAKFNELHSDSAFHQILHNQPLLPHGGPTLYRSMLMVQKNDKRLAFICREMKRAQEIKHFVFDSVSGRPRVTFPDGNRQSFSEASDLLARCSHTLVKKIAKLDKDQKRRSRPRPRSGK